MEEGGIYLHIPFCRRKCLYCDFYTGGLRIADWHIYITALLKELELRKEEINFNPKTLYIGGGTPSLIPGEKFLLLTEKLNKKLQKNNWEEFTIEVNPEDVNEENCKVWKRGGVNRISIGIQTLNDDELKIIGRAHTSLTALNGLELLQKYFSNISVDLMFGIPNQTIESYSDTIDKILSLKPNHISSYSLMLEPGTPMSLLGKEGKFKFASEEEWIGMYKLTLQKLKKSGFSRYEISNYSFEGYHSRHNTNYWLGKPYLGLGPSAHSYDGSHIRRANPNDIKGYINNFTSDLIIKKPFYDLEILSEEEKREEMIMTRLRMAKGINISEFEKQFGERKKIILLQQSAPYIKKGFMKEENGNLKFTDEGFMVSDSIMSDFF